MKNYRTLISLSFALTCGLAACADTDDSLSDLQDSLHKKGRSVEVAYAAMGAVTTATTAMKTPRRPRATKVTQAA